MLQRACSVHTSLGGDVCRMRFFFREEQPNVECPSAVLDFCAPFAEVGTPRYAKKPTGAVVGAGKPLVLGVLDRRYLPQISPSIVRLVAISVIDHLRWPLTSHVEEGETVGRIASVFNAYVAVTIPGSPANIASLPLSAINAPSKNASLWVVVKKFAQTLCGKIRVSHDAPVKRIGQRPVSVDSAAPALLF